MGYMVAGTDATSINPTSDAIVSPTNEGEKWSHPELIEHLRGQELRFRVEPLFYGGIVPPTQEFVFGDKSEGIVRVQLRKTAQEAKDVAGAAPPTTFDRKEGALSGRYMPAFSWGRFVFVSESTTLLDRIEQCLK